MANYRKILILFLLTVAILFLGNNKSENKTIECKYFTENIFKNNLSKATKYEIESKPVALVVPHNETIMDMTASAIYSVSQYDYETVILLSVNHKAQGGKILIYGDDFKTPVGTVYGDNEAKDIIKNSLGSWINEDETIISEDHSASVIMPYIKTYMPNTKTVTMLFTPKTSINDVIKVSEILNELSKSKKILLIGSIDFSHYQSYEDAVEYDDETINLINSFNVEELKLKDGKNLDSAESMSIILKYSQLKEINKINIFEHRIVGNMPTSNDYGSYISMCIGG